MDNSTKNQSKAFMNTAFKNQNLIAIHVYIHTDKQYPYTGEK